MSDSGEGPRPNLSACGVGLAAVILLGLLEWGGVLAPVERVLSDQKTRLLSDAVSASGRVKLILLDQATLDWGLEENQLSWPWPRQAYVPILDFCRRAGARAVGFDVLYTEPSAYSDFDDQSLAEAMQKTDRLTLAAFLSSDPPSSTKAAASQLPSNAVIQVSGNVDSGRSSHQSILLPIDALRSAAGRLGNVSARADTDGVYRSLPVVESLEGQWMASLGAALYLQGEFEAVPELQIQDQHIRIGDQTFSVASDLSGRLRYRDRESFEVYSASAVIQSELRLQAGDKPVLDPTAFEDAYVLFGFSAPGLKDLRPTPLNPAAPGVLIHATLLDNLLQKDLLKGIPTGWVILFTVLLAVGGSRAMFATSGAGQAAALILLLPLIPLGASYGAGMNGWVLPVVFPGLSLFFALVGTLGLRYATEGRQKRFIKQAFRHYLSPAVIDQILEDPSQLRLGGERRELSLLFSDIAGFSSIAEGMDPESLTALLNEYLSLLTDIIQSQGGTVDKFIGDAIVAFWNAPLTQEDHSARALKAAAACQRALAEKNEEFEARYGTGLSTRFGLHRGEVVVGNMGSRERFDYSVLGDAANLASRLEGVNKVFGTAILASEDLWNASDAACAGRCIGQVRVVGRSEPVRIYEVYPEAAPDDHVSGESIQQALEHLQQGRLKEAQELFISNPSDPVAQTYSDRIQQALDEGTDWDGVWNLTSK